MGKLRYRLGLDVGTNSLGWCVYLLNENDEPTAIKRLGSRIFSDGREPKALASLAADRRLARQARRRRDRVLKRRRRLMNDLVEAGLMPANPNDRKLLQAIDPYQLRARGLDECLTPHELGRALFHLARKRGFKSSRKDARDAEAEKETGKVKSAIAALRQRIDDAKCRTVGEYLWKQHEQRLPVRARRSSDGQYVLYLQRDMVAEEFERLWQAQRRHHPEVLNDKVGARLRDTLLFQRPLRPVTPGRCLFENDEYRARLCAPLQQRFRMLQELNNLRIKDGLGFRPLTLKERNDMYSRLRSETGVVSFSTLAKAAGFKNATVFNLERDEKRRGLAGDRVGAAFADPNVLGAQWDALDPKCQHGLAVLVEQAGQVEPLILALQALPDNLEPARGIVGKQHDVEEVLAGLAQLPSCMNEASRRAIASLRLPDDFGSLSLKALARIVPEMEREVVTYDVAVQRAGYSHHSQMYTGEIRRMLPYYGEILTGYTAPAPTSKDPNEREYGRIPNPTVHIGLNQLRQLINALSKRYGTPREIIIELTREFGLSGQKRRDIQKMQAENQDRNDAFNNELIRLGVTPNRDNRLKLQLWYELGRSDALDRYCVYSGHRLSMTSLFSDEIEVDHVLPFSRSLHDGVGNKVLCTRQSNRDKGNRTPFEAFGTRESWPEIVDRAARLPGRKPALFQENALEEFLGESDFLARHLTDTAYFGRAARQYLCTVCHPDRVWVSSGRLTGLLRAKWGLSRLLSEDGGKNREDHRHHALDAAVVGICSRSIIQRMAAAASRAESRGEQRLLEDLDLPWDGYRHDLADSLQKVIVSHKPEHGREGALHNDTNYGRRGAARPDGMTVVAHRKPLETIANSRDAARIVDPVLRNLVTRAIDSAGSPKEVKAALSRLTGSLGIRRAMVEEPLTVISINDRRTGEPYRFVKGDSNYCREIFLTESGRWDSLLVSTFEANSAGFSMSGRTAQNGRPLVMRIRKGDMLLIETNGDAKVMLVQKFTPDGLALAEHFEGNADARARSKQKTGFDFIRKSPEPLRALKARLVGVDVLGYVNDPGFG